jgi:hypothetical protein
MTTAIEMRNAECGAEERTGPSAVPRGDRYERFARKVEETERPAGRKCNGPCFDYRGRQMRGMKVMNDLGTGSTVGVWDLRHYPLAVRAERTRLEILGR